MNYEFLYPGLIPENPWLAAEREREQLEAARIAEFERLKIPNQPLEYIPIDAPIEQPVVEQWQPETVMEPAQTVLDTLSGVEAPTPTSNSRFYNIHEPVDFRTQQSGIGLSLENPTYKSTYTPTDFSKFGTATDIFNKVQPLTDSLGVKVPKVNIAKRKPANKPVAKTQKKAKAVKPTKPQFLVKSTTSVGPNGKINTNHRTLQFANPDADYARLYALKEARARESLARAGISREVALANAMRGR